MLLAAAMLLGSCEGGSEMGTVEVDLFDQPVDCDADVEACFAEPEPGSDEIPAPVTPERHRTWVFFSDQTTAHSPDGAYLYFEMVRAEGVRAYVEIDVPTTEGETDTAVMHYTEYEGDEVVFESDEAYGRMELAQDLQGVDCSCADGRLELVFVDAGEDEELDTDDDRVRRLSRGRFSWSKEFCVGARMLGMTSDRVDVSVRVVDRCRSRPGGTVSEPDPPDYSSSSSYGGEASCESGDYSGGSTTSSSGGGCEGDSSSGGGCEGDTASSSGGCEGDTASSSGGCSGDTGGGGGCSGDAGGSSSCSTTTIVPRRPACRRGPSGPAAVLGSSRAQLVLGILLALVWLERRRRRA